MLGFQLLIQSAWLRIEVNLDECLWTLDSKGETLLGQDDDCVAYEEV
jgi:hypothetical protein